MGDCGKICRTAKLCLVVGINLGTNGEDIERKWGKIYYKFSITFPTLGLIHTLTRLGLQHMLSSLPLTRS